MPYLFRVSFSDWFGGGVPGNLVKGRFVYQWRHSPTPFYVPALWTLLISRRHMVIVPFIQYLKQKHWYHRIHTPLHNSAQHDHANAHVKCEWWITQLQKELLAVLLVRPLNHLQCARLCAGRERQLLQLEFRVESDIHRFSNRKWVCTICQLEICKYQKHPWVHWESSNVGRITLI